MNDRIYVCHTYYHAYVSFLKELKLRAEKNDIGDATMVLSTMSSNFEDFPKRVAATNIFKDVIMFDEKRESNFPELDKYMHGGKGGIIGNMYRRIVLTKKFAKLEEEFIPVNFKEYKDIYVFSDADPIGVYLNQHKIYYHALEDGLNCIQYVDTARFANRGHFGLKVFFSKKLNLISIESGYGKYCIDMEVNDISVLEYPCPYYIEQSRKELTDRLTQTDKDVILKAFVRDKEGVETKLSEATKKGDGILILTDPLCTMDVRKRIFSDICDMYKDQGTVFIKPHPRDYLDYFKEFPDYPIFDATMPMEMINFFEGVHFKKVVGVLTELKAISFADEVERLGPDFMDKYEDPKIHRQNEQIY